MGIFDRTNWEKAGNTQDSAIEKINSENRRKKFISKLKFKTSGIRVTRNSQYSRDDRNNSKLKRNQNKYSGR